MEDNIQISACLNVVQNEVEEDEFLKAIAQAIIEHEDEFEPYFARLIDLGDANLTVVGNSLQIEACNIELTGEKGVAHGEFTSDFYASCKDMRAQDDQEVSLKFTLKGNQLYFDIALPSIWRPD
jgi:hypothetical protein